jgi:hypothetical protein
VNASLVLLACYFKLTLRFKPIIERVCRLARCMTLQGNEVCFQGKSIVAIFRRCARCKILLVRVVICWLRIVCHVIEVGLDWATRAGELIPKVRLSLRTPQRTKPDAPVDQRHVKANVVSSLFAFKPFVPQDLVALSQEFLVESGRNDELGRFVG